jgi:phosphoserine phosphatase
MKKAFVFDFDDTLATTDCRVIVRREPTDREICRLTPAEFNEFKLDDDDDRYFDFSEFTKLINPQASWLFPLAKEVYKEGQAVYILTARGDLAGEAIAQFLCDHGIVAKEIHCIGNNPGEIEEEKRKVMLTIIEGYDKIYFYDDHSGNIDAMPQSNKLRKYLV